MLKRIIIRFSMSGKKIHPKYNRQFIDKTFQQTLTFLQSTLKGQNKCVDFKKPEELHQLIDFQVRDDPCPESELLKATKDILQYQVKPYHPHFHNQLFGGFDQYSYVGAVMANTINGSIYTYEVSPCYTLMENSLFEHMRKILGWEAVDGTMTPGGSFANFMAIHLARHRIHPDFTKKGIYGCKPMKIITSEVSHYSMKKGANLCGIGTDNIIYVKVDENRRMIPSELEKVIEEQKYQGNDILLVNSTVGTTVEGSIDPVKQIGQICKKHGIWHHVDAAFGGAIIMSETLIKKVQSWKDVDSITFDPHKALVVPLQTSIFLTQEKYIMPKCNSANADYLFHKERASYDGSLDVGDKTLQCGRVIDIVKFWTYLKGNGWKVIAKQVEAEHQLALYVKKFVQDHPDRFELAVECVDTFNVCFWYIPLAMEKKKFQKEEEFYSMLGKITVLAKKYMMEEGKMMLGYSKSKNNHYFWRIVMSNPYNTTEDVHYEMKLIGEYCEQAYKELTN